MPCGTRASARCGVRAGAAPFKGELGTLRNSSEAETRAPGDPGPCSAPTEPPIELQLLPSAECHRLGRTAEPSGLWVGLGPAPRSARQSSVIQLHVPVLSRCLLSSRAIRDGNGNHESEMQWVDTGGYSAAGAMRAEAHGHGAREKGECRGSFTCSPTPLLRALRQGKARHVHARKGAQQFRIR
jgi:hypothetical protein